MAYTTINKSTLHFNTKLHTGNGAEQAITGVGFQPDFTWIKKRNGTAVHYLFDAVRGATKFLNSDQNYAQQDNAQSLKSFDSDGFTLGTMAGANNNSDTFVSWNWKAGTGQGSSNTDGSINTTYTSVNTTAGFSVSQWTGSGANATIGHGLGVAPKMIMVKNLSTTDSWNVFHVGIGNGKRVFLDTNGAESSTSDAWNSTSPTTSVFSVGTNTGTNNNGSNLIAYCFAEKTGFSKIGKYTGNNNADGAFVYTGFKPAWVMIKNSAATLSWLILDNKRDTHPNPQKDALFPNTNAAQTGDYLIDFNSNGFKIRTATSALSGNSQELIYMAFAATPLVGSNNVPATAR